MFIFSFLFKDRRQLIADPVERLKQVKFNILIYLLFLLIYIQNNIQSCLLVDLVGDYQMFVFI